MLKFTVFNKKNLVWDLLTTRHVEQKAKEVLRVLESNDIPNKLIVHKNIEYQILVPEHLVGFAFKLIKNTY